MAINGYAQSAQQVDGFKKEFISAWEQKDPHSFDALFYHDSAHEDIIKRYIEDWQKLRDNPDGAKIPHLNYISKDDYERSLNGDSAEEYTWMEQVFDQTPSTAKRGVCFNIPLAGVVQITLQKQIFIVPVGMHGGKLYIAGTRNATEQERADARLMLAKQRHVNTGLLALRRLVGRANEAKQNVSLIVVNRGDKNHLMINNNEVAKADLKDWIIDLEKNRGEVLPIIIVDCGDESKSILDLLNPIVESYLIECVVYIYGDSRGSEDASNPVINTPDVEQDAPSNGGKPSN